MGKYRYTALAPDGSEVSGTVQATTDTAARTDLIERELRVVEMAPKKSVMKLEIARKRVPKSDVMHLSRQMAAFIRAGVPILDAIDSIREESENSRLKEMLRDIAARLRRGESFSQACAHHESIFPRYYTDMLRSAELTGHLDTVLDQLARYMERDLEARRKIKSALAYPMIIFFMSIVTVVLLAAFVLPRFKTFFQSLDATLPAPTRILLAISGAIGTYWYVMFGGLLAIAVTLFLAVRTPRGKAVKDAFMLRIPVVGEVVQYAIIERFCRVLSSLVQAGVPLPEGMAVAAEGTSNAVYEKALGDVREAMLKGDGLSRPMHATKLFPGAVVQMVRVGEDTGTLDTQLETAGGFYEQELDYKIKRLTALFEPLVIIIMGLLVGFVAIALISAMYGIFNQAGSV